MKKILITAAILLAATPASAIEIVVGAPDNITVVEHAATDATAPVGKAKDNRGDILTFANPIFDAANKTQIGTDNGFCVRTVVGAAFECSWVTSLPGGQITVAGPFHDAGDTTLAITGGTGKYSGVKGEMLLHARDAKGSAYDFKFTFLK